MIKRYLFSALSLVFAGVFVQPHELIAQTSPGSAVSSITGQYAFHLVGQERSSSGGMELVGIAGSVATDGNGNITSGVLDKNSASGYLGTHDIHGTYQLDSTGKGAFNVVTPAGTLSFTVYSVLPLIAGETRGTIVSGSGSISQASGEFGPSGSYYSPVNGNEYITFTTIGKTGAGTGSYVTNSTFNLVPAATSTAGTFSGSVTASGTVVSNGKISQSAESIGAYTGSSSGYPVGGQGRFAITLPVTPGSSKMTHYAVYSGYFPTGTYFFLSTDAHPAAALEVSTSGKTQNYQAGAAN